MLPQATAGLPTPLAKAAAPHAVLVSRRDARTDLPTQTTASLLQLRQRTLPTPFYVSAQPKRDAPFSPGRTGSCPPLLPELRVLPAGSVRVRENQGVELLGVAAIPLNAGGAMLDLEGQQRQQERGAGPGRSKAGRLPHPGALPPF